MTEAGIEILGLIWLLVGFIHDPACGTGTEPCRCLAGQGVLREDETISRYQGSVSRHQGWSPCYLRQMKEASERASTTFLTNTASFAFRCLDPPASRRDPLVDDH